MDREILRNLQNIPAFRERANRTKFFAIMLRDKYRLDVEPSRLKAVIEDVASMDRYWRMHLKNYPALQGSDYDTKKKYVQKAQINLGYESGYNENVHKLKTL